MVTAPALLAAVMSAGAGHGDYVAALALFPWPMLLAGWTGVIGTAAIGLALLQFPAAGAVLGVAFAQRRYEAIALLALVHAIGIAVCFSGAIPNFS